jgi:hypothetical protein
MPRAKQVKGLPSRHLTIKAAIDILLTMEISFVSSLNTGANQHSSG